MKHILLIALTGVGLFVGTVVGLLGFEGRLNHAGTIGVPILESFFPPPEEGDENAEDGQGEDAAKGEHTDEHRRLTVGPGLSEPESESGGHGGGHAAPAGETSESGVPDLLREQPRIDHPRFDPSEYPQELSGGDRYFPGGFFRFPKIDALPGAAHSGQGGGLRTVPIEEKINLGLEALKERQARLNQDTAKVELDEKGLRMIQIDVRRRETLLAAQNQKIELKRNELDVENRIFEQRVILVKQKELQELTNYAKDLAFMAESDVDKARKTVRGMLGLDKKQQTTQGRKHQMIKVLGLMSPDAFGQILMTMGVDDIQVILKEKLKFTIEEKKQ